MPRRKQNANLLGGKSAFRQMGEAFFSQRYPQRYPTTPARPKRVKKTGSAARESEGWGTEESEKALRAWQRKYGKNPAKSAEQYRLAQAVLSGTARKAGMSKSAAQEIVDRTPAQLRRLFMKKNPEDAAAALSEAWHGRPAKEATDYVEKIHFHGVLTDLGQLQEIKIWVDDKHTQAIEFDDDTRLASNEKGEQLYIVGGDQSINLGDFGIEGHAAAKDLVTIGPCYSVTYITAKEHLGKQDKLMGPYEHVFAEEDQDEPDIVYDNMNKMLGFSDGEYHIDATDYDGKHSAGIRD